MIFNKGDKVYNEFPLWSEHKEQETINNEVTPEVQPQMENSTPYWNQRINYKFTFSITYVRWVSWMLFAAGIGLIIYGSL